MQKVLVPAALAAAVGFAAPAAHAIRPDFDGEQGIEGFFTAGYGSLVATSERVFQSTREATGAGTPANALSGGYNLRFGVGYRITPLVSIGLTFALQGMDAAPITSPAGSDPASAMAFGVGAYARFYFAPLITGTLTVRRVNLAGAGDPRRFDPWASLGVEYFALSRSAHRQGTPEGADWNIASLSFPIMAGFDYRLINELAVGVSVGLAPMATVGSQRTETFLLGGNTMTSTTSFGNATGGNAAWSVGVDLRYTFSL